MQALQAGARVNAELLGLEEELGTLEHVSFVMLGGRVVRSP